MAEKFVFQLVIDVNGKSAKSGIKSVVDTIRKELNQEFKIKLDFPNSKSVSDRLSRMTRRLQTFNSELQRLAKFAPAASAGIASIAGSTGIATEAFKDLRISSSQANKVIQGTASVVNQGATAMERLGAQTALTARRYAGFVVSSRFLFGFERALESAFSGAIEFNTELVKIAQVTNLPIAAITDLKKEIFSLGASFATPVEDLNNAAKILSQAGFSLSETKELLKSIAPTTLGATFGDITETVDGLIAILNQFNIEATKSAVVLDTLNVLAAKYPAEVSDIIEITKRAGAVFASSSGVTEGLKDSVVAFQELAAVGTAVRSTTRLNAAQIGTSLKTIFSRIQNPDVLQDLRALGIELTDTKNNFVGPLEALKRLDQRLQGVSKNSVLFADIANTIGGLRQIDKTIALLSNLELVMKALGDAQSDANVGSVLRDAETALGDIGNQYKALKQQFTELINSVVSSQTFKVIASGLLKAASLFLEAGKVLTPFIPVIGSIASIKAGFGLAQFFKGFRDNIKFLNTNTQALHRNTSAILNLGRSLGISRLPSFSAKPVKRASGGIVRGPGGSRDDSILTAISNGEYVISAEAVRKVGLPFLNSVNRGEIPGFASGGLAGGGATAGSLRDILKEALAPRNVDFSQDRLVSQARVGAKAFGLNPDAIEKIIISQLKQGIEPRNIRSTIHEMFTSIRKFIDQEKLGLRGPIQTSAPNGILGAPAFAILPQDPFKLTRDPNLPVVGKDVPIPNPQLNRPQPIGLPSPARLLGLPAPTEADFEADRIRKLKQQGQKDLDFVRARRNPPRIVDDGRAAIRADFVRKLARFGNQDIANAVFDKLEKKVTSLAELERIATDRINRILAKANITVQQNDVLGDTTFGRGSSRTNRFTKLRDKLIARGRTEDEATRLADIALSRPKAGARPPVPPPSGFRPKVASGLGKLGKGARGLAKGVGGLGVGFVSSLLLDLIPTKEDNPFNIAKGAASGAATGAFVGSAIPVIGTALGALGGAIFGAASAFGVWKSALTTTEIENFQKALDKAKTDQEKSQALAGIIGTLFKEGQSGFTLTEGGRQRKLQESFGRSEGSIQAFADLLFERAKKAGAGSLAEYLDKEGRGNGDLSAALNINKFAQAAGIQFDLADIVDRQLTQNNSNVFAQLSTKISETLNFILVRELKALSKNINVAAASLQQFEEATSQVARQGLGDFGGPFRQVSIGTGSTAEIYRSLPGVQNTVLGSLLESRDIVNDELNGQLLRTATGNPEDLRRYIDTLTKRQGISATLRNSLKQQTKDVLAGSDDLTSAEKFTALQEVLQNFVDDPVFDAAQQVVQDYVNLVNQQNSAIQQNIDAYLQLINAQRQNALDAVNIRAEGREFGLRFTQRFPDNVAAIGRARGNMIDRFRTLFPNVNANSPAAIGSQIAAERNRLNQLSQDPVANAAEIRTTQDKLGQLVGALKFVRDSVDELTAVETRLAEINQGRENAVSFARRIATASPEELAQINSQINGLRAFEGGAKLSAGKTAGALDLIDQLLTLDNNTLAGFGRSKEELQKLQEDIIRRRFAKVTTGGDPILAAFANAPGADKESQDLLRRGNDINNNRANAAGELGKIAGDRINDINTILAQQLKLFEDQKQLLTNQLNNINRLDVISERLTQIPTEIAMKGDVNVNVTFTNGQFLNEIDESIKKLVQEQIKAALKLREQEDFVNGK